MVRRLQQGQHLRQRVLPLKKTMGVYARQALNVYQVLVEVLIVATKRVNQTDVLSVTGQVVAPPVTPIFTNLQISVTRVLLGKLVRLDLRHALYLMVVPAAPTMIALRAFALATTAATQRGNHLGASIAVQTEIATPAMPRLTFQTSSANNVSMESGFPLLRAYKIVLKEYLQA